MKWKIKDCRRICANMSFSGCIVKKYQQIRPDYETIGFGSYRPDNKPRSDNHSIEIPLKNLVFGTLARSSQWNGAAMSVLIVTSLGDIVVDLHADRCPLTSKNFLKLCKYGSLWLICYWVVFWCSYFWIFVMFGVICWILVVIRAKMDLSDYVFVCRMKYYNGCLFHKVEKDFLAQTGDRTGTGTSGESVYKLVFLLLQTCSWDWCFSWTIVYLMCMWSFIC